MFKIEKRFLDFVEKKYYIIFVAFGLLLSLLVRFLAFGFVSSDMEGYLLGWFGQIEQLGRIKALKVQVGNYSVLYQTLIAIMTYIPINPLYQFKILSVIFDYSLAFVSALIVYDLCGKKKIAATFAGFAVLFWPSVFVNSAVWGQCDSIYVSFGLWALYAFSKKKYLPAFILYGVACSFKLQAVFLLPFLLFAYVKKKEFSLLYFLVPPITMEILAIPAMIMGRGWKAAFSVYYYQTQSCDRMYFGYYGFWSLFTVQNDGQMSHDMIANLKVPAVILAVATLAALMAAFIVSKSELDAVNSLLLSFLMVYTCVVFLPGMHERYGFFYEIAAIIIAFIIPKTIPLLFVIMSVSALTYGGNLFMYFDNNPLLGIANMAVYFSYIAIIFFRLYRSANQKEGV